MCLKVIKIQGFFEKFFEAKTKAKQRKFRL